MFRVVPLCSVLFFYSIYYNTGWLYLSMFYIPYISNSVYNNSLLYQYLIPLHSNLHLLIALKLLLMNSQLEETLKICFI